jgi:hypothetical protein
MELFSSDADSDWHIVWPIYGIGTGDFRTMSNAVGTPSVRAHTGRTERIAVRQMKIPILFELASAKMYNSGEWVDGWLDFKITQTACCGDKSCWSA